MAKKQLGINIFSNMVTFLVNILISFVLTPYLIRTIGNEVYGFFPLANNFINYITIITSAFNAMAARFISLKLYENKENEANEYFSTVFYINFIIAILISILTVMIIPYLNKIIKIPPKLDFSIKLLFESTLISFALSLISSVFGTSTFCKNRLDLASISSIVQSIIRVFILIVLFTLFKPNIAYLGIAAIIVSLIDVGFNIYFKKRLVPNIKISTKYFDKKIIKELINSGVWSSFCQLSSVLLTGLDLLFANIFIGPYGMSVLAIAKTLPNLITNICGTVAGAFTPEFMIYYAKKDYQNLIKEIKSSLKIMGLFANISAAWLIVFGNIFYKMWVPTQDNNLIQILSIISIAYIFISGSIIPLYSIFTLTNNLKEPAITLFYTGLLNVIIVILLLHFTNTGLYAIAGVSTILITIREIIFIPMYASSCLHLDRKTFYPNIFKNVFSASILVCIFLVLKKLTTINSWITLIMVTLLAGIIGVIVNIFFSFNKEERKKWARFIKMKL